MPIHESESQDIAVIEVEKIGDDEAILQIVGDEDLYGIDYIIEPTDAEMSGDRGGPEEMTESEEIVVNVWIWPTVRYIYAPRYTVYVSPWRWALYPDWWKPWRPYRWSLFHSRRAHYRIGFGPTTTHRVTHAHQIYRPVRRTSITVKRRSVTRVSVRSKTEKNRRGVNRKSLTSSKTNKSKTVKNGQVVKSGKKKTVVKKGKKDKVSVKTTKKTKVKKTKKTKAKNNYGYIL